MEKKQINKTCAIRANVCKETKSAFLAKLHSVKCNEPSLFLAFLLDKWTEREKILDNPRGKSFKILFSLMPADAPYKRMKTGDVILVYKYCGSKRFEWVYGIEKEARRSEYNITSAVCRSLVYAVILATSELLAELYCNYVASEVGLTKFKSTTLFRFNIDEKAYEKLYNMYDIIPSRLIYILIKIMLDESSYTRKILLDNINKPQNKYGVKKSSKGINVEVHNDLLRLKILQLMADLKFSTKAGLAYALIDLAMDIPHLIKEELSSGSYQMDNTDDEYQLENDMFEHMSNLSYKFDRQ